MNNKFKAQSLNRKSYRKFMSWFSVTCFKHVGLLWPISALDRKQVRGYDVHRQCVSACWVPMWALYAIWTTAIALCLSVFISLNLKQRLGFGDSQHWSDEPQTHWTVLYEGTNVALWRTVVACKSCKLNRTVTCGTVSPLNSWQHVLLRLPVLAVYS